MGLDLVMPKHYQMGRSGWCLSMPVAVAQINNFFSASLGRRLCLLLSLDSDTKSCVHNQLEFRQYPCHTTVPSLLPENEAKHNLHVCNLVPAHDTGVSQSVIPDFMVSSIVNSICILVWFALLKNGFLIHALLPCNQRKHLTRTILTLKKYSFQKCILHVVF